MSDGDFINAISLAECVDLALEQARSGDRDWRRWGPYSGLRQWATPREDYSASGDPWRYFPATQAASRAYRWGEDGLFGLCDRDGLLHFAFSFWNGHDACLKERLDVDRDEVTGRIASRENFAVIQATPTYSYAMARYLYPHPPAMGANSGGDDHFEILIEYAKGEPDDLLIRLTATNRSALPASLHVIPTLWFRNTWAWSRQDSARPVIRHAGDDRLIAEHPRLGRTHFFATNLYAGETLFTDNETNRQLLFDTPNAGPYVKDAIQTRIIGGRSERCNPNRRGTRAARHYAIRLLPHAPLALHFRLYAEDSPGVDGLGHGFEELIGFRQSECREWLGERAGFAPWQQRACATALCARQYHSFHVAGWLDGDPSFPRPLDQRGGLPNQSWRHLNLAGVIAVADPTADPTHASWARALGAWSLAHADRDRSMAEFAALLELGTEGPNGERPTLERDLSWPLVPLEAWALARTLARLGEDAPATESLTHALPRLEEALTHWSNHGAGAWCGTAPDGRDLLPDFLWPGASWSVATAWTAVQAAALVELYAAHGDDDSARHAADRLLGTAATLAGADPNDPRLFLPLLLAVATVPASRLAGLPATSALFEAHGIAANAEEACRSLSPVTPDQLERAAALALDEPRRLTPHGLAGSHSRRVDVLENALVIEGLLQRGAAGTASLPAPAEYDPPRRFSPFDLAREIAARLTDAYVQADSGPHAGSMFGGFSVRLPGAFDAATGAPLDGQTDAIGPQAFAMLLRDLAELPETPPPLSLTP